MQPSWTILVYKLPGHPSRHRLAVWRKLQALGSLYLQDGVCILPARDDLEENLQYVAQQVTEVGGTATQFTAITAKAETQKLVARFVEAADDKGRQLTERLVQLRERAEEACLPPELERAEEDLKRERIAYLRLKRIAYFGFKDEEAIRAALKAVRSVLDASIRGGK